MEQINAGDLIESVVDRPEYPVGTRGTCIQIGSIECEEYLSVTLESGRRLGPILADSWKMVERGVISMSVTVKERMATVSRFRASSLATKNEYRALVEQIEEMRAKADALRNSYRRERDKAASMLTAIQEDCDHGNRRILHNKDKPWMLRDMCPDCRKVFASGTSLVPVQPKPEEPVLDDAIVDVLEDVIEKVEAEVAAPVVDSRVVPIRRMVPELLVHSWTADVPFRTFVQRAWHQFDNSMDFFEFENLVFKALNVSSFAFPTKNSGGTVRQFLAKFYKPVNDRLWDGATNDDSLRLLCNMLGFTKKGCAKLVIKARLLTKKSDWKTVK